MIITEPTEPEETGGEEAASEESESLATSAVSSLPEESAAADAEKEIEKGRGEDAKDQRPQQHQEDVFARKAEERRKMLQSLMEENKSVLTNIVASEIKKRQESIDSGGEPAISRSETEDETASVSPKAVSPVTPVSSSTQSTSQRRFSPVCHQNQKEPSVRPKSRQPPPTETPNLSVPSRYAYITWLFTFDIYTFSTKPSNELDF